MTVSMRKMSAVKGYEYLLRSVAVGDGNRALTTPLTRYYAEADTPPGGWMGSGLGEFVQGQIVEDSVVTQSQLALLLGMGRDPVTGPQLGRAYQEFPTVPQRIAKRIEGIEPGLSDGDREAEITKIEKEENRKGPRVAVAGFDFTFSVPKSVSVLWGVADAGTQALIVEAHHEAVAQVVAFLEREVAVTRAGSNARNGAVAQHEVLGITARNRACRPRRAPTRLITSPVAHEHSCAPASRVSPSTSTKRQSNEVGARLNSSTPKASSMAICDPVSGSPIS